MPKRKGNLALVEDDMDIDDDEFELDEDDELEDDDDREEEDYDFEDEDDEEEAAAPPPKPVRKGSKRTPAPVAEADDEDDDDEDFEEAARNVAPVPNEPSRRPGLRNLSDDALVIELTELIMQGDDSEMTSILVPVFTGPRGAKIAKKLVREARDRAIAKLKRVADVASVNIDTFSDD